MHDHDGRAWITLDGEEIINMVHIWKWLYELEKKAASLAGGRHVRDDPRYNHFKNEAKKALQRESFFTQTDLGSAMHAYQSLSIEDVLASENHIIRAIGMFDRRLGKRRLKTIDIISEHELVKTTYYFRARAEGIIMNEQSIEEEKRLESL
jgi:hypothetical protein